jgi:hypothetical protein
VIDSILEIAPPRTDMKLCGDADRIGSALLHAGVKSLCIGSIIIASGPVNATLDVAGS